MKKMLILSTALIAFTAVILITNTKQEERSNSNPYGKKELHPATIKQLTDPNYQNLILPDELAADLHNKKNKTVYFYSPKDSQSQHITPIVAPLAEKMGIDLVQFNLLEFKESQDDYHIDTLPTIVYFKNGVEVERIVGSNEEATFRKWFEKNEIN